MSANRFKLNEDKTELLWTGSDHTIRKLPGNGPTLTWGTDIINASVGACSLRVTITPSLRLAKHASIVGGKCFFFRLSQQRRVRRSVDADSAVTLIHTFIISHIDYDNCLFAGAPKVWTDNIQRVINGALHVFWLRRTNTIRDSLESYTATYTGWMSQKGSSTNCASWFLSASMEWRRHTSQNCTSQ